MRASQVRATLARGGLGWWQRQLLELPVIGTTLCRRQFPAFLAVLTTLHEHGQFTEVIEASQMVRHCTRLAVDALAAEDTASYTRWSRVRLPRTHAVALAEIIASAHIQLSMITRDTIEKWLTPLLVWTTEQYVTRLTMARILCEHINVLTDPTHVVATIEAHVAPRAWDDYSNFQEVFSMRHWRCFRALLTHPRIITEHERFVTRHDRHAFWNVFTQSMEEQQ